MIAGCGKGKTFALSVRSEHEVRTQYKDLDRNLVIQVAENHRTGSTPPRANAGVFSIPPLSRETSRSVGPCVNL